MSSPWLIEMSVQIAELLSDYVKEIGKSKNLIELYEAIEAGRIASNKAHPPWEQIEQEWSKIGNLDEGVSLNFIDEFSEKIAVIISDEFDSIYLRIYGNDGNAFVVHVLGKDDVHILEYNSKLITDENQGALIELLLEGVFGFEIVPNEPPKEFWVAESNTVH